MWAYEAERGAVKRTGGTDGQSPLPFSNSLVSGPQEPPVRPVSEKESGNPGGVVSVEGSIRGRQYPWKAASVEGSISELHSRWRRSEGQGPLRGEGRVVALACLVA